MGATELSPETLDRGFAVDWYRGWIDAWNSNRPGRVFDRLTEDACYLYPTYDLLGLMKQIGLYRGATAGP